MGFGRTVRREFGPNVRPDDCRLRRQRSGQAVHRRCLTPLAIDLATSSELILAPDVVRIEVASAITRAYRNQTVTKAEAEQKIGQWSEFLQLSNLQLTPFHDLLSDGQARSIELRHPVMDCLYLSLAVRRQVPLFTADEPLCKTGQSKKYDVRHLSTLNQYCPVISRTTMAG